MSATRRDKNIIAKQSKQDVLCKPGGTRPLQSTTVTVPYRLKVQRVVRLSLIKPLPPLPSPRELRNSARPKTKAATNFPLSRQLLGNRSRVVRKGAPPQGSVLAKNAHSQLLCGASCVVTQYGSVAGCSSCMHSLPPPAANVVAQRQSHFKDHLHLKGYLFPLNL